MVGRYAIATILLLVSTVAPGRGLDLSGKWRFEELGEIAVLTQVGSALSLTLFGVTYNGSVSEGTPFSTYSVAAFPPGAEISIVGRITPSEDLLDVRAVYIDISFQFYVDGDFARRCACDDGNTVSGDGCDAECQIEPCWSCTGDPSVCTPLGDASACEDGSACTTGETCSGGVCGGGSPVSPCTDMSGPWLRDREVPSLGESGASIGTFRQIGTDVIGVDNRYVGTIEPSTGAFDLRAPILEFFLSCVGFDPLVGTVAADSETYAATGSVHVLDEQAPEFCDEHPLTETGSRCGNGEIAAGEQCDDGNADTGDGCDPSCAVETCWDCQGEPSLCAAAVQTTCTQSTAPNRSLLVIKDRVEPAKDRLLWRWKKGGALTLEDLGDPLAGAAYELCVFDESGPLPQLAFSAVVPAASACGSATCWKPKGTSGYRYVRNDGAPDGAAALRLRAGGDGQAAVLFKGRGSFLSDRAGGLPELPLSLPLRTQLRGSAGVCVETVHDAASVVANDVSPGVFKAHGSAP